jgi:hypothetical protein
MATAIDIVNAVIETSSTLKDNIPLATNATLQATGGAIMQYTPFMNEFINGLVNRILFQEAHNMTYDNPLRIFKGVDIPYGTDVQDNIANPAVATPYDSSAMSDVLSPASPDVKTVYYRRNRQDKYKVTVYDAVLAGAFTNADTFSNFVSMILNTLTSGDNIDEFKLMKGVVGQAINEGNINKTTLTVGADHRAFAENLVTNLRAKYLQFQFPSTNYNCYQKMATDKGITNATPLTTWTSPDRISVLVRADVAAFTDVEVLAKAFNMSKADFLGRQVLVDSFGDTGFASKTLAIIADNTFLRTHDNRFQMAETPYNASTLSRTYFLHHWETMACSPFANAWAFIEKESS